MAKTEKKIETETEAEIETEIDREGETEKHRQRKHTLHSCLVAVHHHLKTNKSFYRVF